MIALRSYAKINLGLEITGRRADGYHTLRTLFQTIDLSDDLELRETRLPRIRLSGDDPRVPWNDSNTIARACRLVYENFPLRRGFDIAVRKNIPPGAGLGGGSGNAAVMLLFLDRYFNLHIPPRQLNEMAAGLGADVPFFLRGGTALGEGIGEELTRVPALRPRPVALCLPPLSVSTALVFSRLRLTKAGFPSKIQLFLRKGDFSILTNELENAAFELFPEIRDIKEKMSRGGCGFVQMTGSGSAVFGFGHAQHLSALARRLPGTILTRTISRKYYQESIGVSPNGKASAFGADIRRFESSRPRKTT
jgi:4-diphosphocytidyl-2-C-methyl-D-erythritol kinase